MKRRLSIWIICFLLVLFSGVFSLPCGAEQKKLSLEEVLKKAFNRNPSIAVSRHEVAALDAVVAQATAAYLPQFSNTTNYLRVGGGLPDALGSAIGNTSRQGGSGGIDMNLNSPFNVYNTNFLVSQYIYDFGRTPGKVEQSRRNLHASQKDLDKTIADVVRDVKHAYFEVLKKVRLVEVEEESLAIYDKHLEQARALYRSGLRPKIDVTKGMVDRAKTKLRLVKARFAVRTARVDLEKVLGGPPVEGDYTLAKISSPPPPPTNIDLLIQKAVGQRPEIGSLKDWIRAADAQIKVARSGYWPSITANGGYGWASTEFPLKDYWLGWVSLKWEIFSGFKTQGQEREAHARLERLKAKLRQAELSVIQEVSQAFIGVLESSETIETARVALGEARENMGLAEGRYRTGVGDAIEFADAELTLTEAKSDLVQATYQYLQDYADLEHAVGGWKGLGQPAIGYQPAEPEKMASLNRN